MLITGGAGFIGSHTVDYFIKKGFEVSVIDNLNKYSHKNNIKPKYLNHKAKYFFGDCRNSTILNKALEGVSYVIHDCSLVGTGHSMQNFDEYISNNVEGTSNLWKNIINKRIKIKKFIQASSVSVYGEGAYKCNKHGIFYPIDRGFGIKNKIWKIRCPKCKTFCDPFPTSEKSPLYSKSIYSLTKQHQEQISKMIGETYGYDVAICRYFNCYGSRLSLSNPYTGVTSIFINNIINNNKPTLFEDGEQLRDYIHVSDVVRAKYHLLLKTNLRSDVFNLGTGKSTSLNKLIKLINKINKSDINPYITNEFRVGDIRSSFADIKLLKNSGFKNFIKLNKGLEEMIDYAKFLNPKSQKNIYFDMKKKGLIIP